MRGDEATAVSTRRRPEPGAARWSLMLAAIGVVYGDIGTSPLYAVKECFSPHSTHHVPVTVENVLGILSLVFWALLMVVSVKYLVFVLRADNDGQGGILALLALVPRRTGNGGAGWLALLVLFGAALLTGEGVITPAISVLSAVEGLGVATNKLEVFVVPITCGVLIALFAVQRKGTGGIGKVFGPITVTWFVTIAVLGVRELVTDPAVLAAADPRHAVRFLQHHRGHGFLLLGGVVLAITGVEALYADMGHFGRGPIRVTWFSVVWPALLLNYFGQGALLLARPASATNPFYGLVPEVALYPVVTIATAATVVASQALISGLFSLIQQAVQLGFFPRVTVIHTSQQTEGQIYIPEVNWGLCIACIGLVLAFRSSGALAAAYGIAVTGTMSITSIVYFVVATRTWQWPWWKAGPLVATFLAIDLSFFTANAAKFFQGGWFPIVLGVALFTVMTTWNAGRRTLAQVFKDSTLPLESFLDDLAEHEPHRVRGTAVFMSSSPTGTPPVLLHHLKHNQVLHEQVVLLSVLALHVPEVPTDGRVEVTSLGLGVYQVIARYGFMQQPNVPQVLALCARKGLITDPARTSYYLGRETLLPTGRSKMWRWRKSLFAYIARNSRPATAYFGLPPNRVVELGMQLDI